MAEDRKETENGEFLLEEAFDQVEKLIERMGDKDVPLEESFTLYQEGMKLLKQCSDRIDRVEKRLLEIDEEGQVHEFS